MEAPDARSELCPLDPQEVKGLGIDDVEATAPVHEHLGEVRVGDDGIDDERVDPRIRDIVWVVITVERDGRLGPVEEEGGSPFAWRRSLDARAFAGMWRGMSRVPRRS
jgi:hypothetical protein